METDERIGGASPGGDPLEAMVCFALYSATQATIGYYREMLAPFGLTYQQFLVLVELTIAGEQSPGCLASALHLDSSSVSGLLNRMERQGLVVRLRDADDRRAVRVAVTERGRDILPRLGFLDGCLASAMDLDAEEARTLIGALHKLRDAVSSAPRSRGGSAPRSQSSTAPRSESSTAPRSEIDDRADALGV